MRHNISDLKKDLRHKIRQEREDFDIHKNIRKNHSIVSNLRIVLDSLRELAIIGMYMPLNGEPDLTEIMLGSNLTIGIPKICSNKIKFVRYNAGDVLKKTQLGIQEPLSNEELIPSIVIAPALAYDLRGYRLGFGSGHYDKYLSNLSTITIKIGICFDKYLLEYIPNAQHDIKFNYIITDKIILKL